MKECKYCKKEINKKAEICPHCGCRLKSNVLKIFIICILSIVFLIAILIGIRIVSRLIDKNARKPLEKYNLDNGWIFYNADKEFYDDFFNVNKSLENFTLYRIGSVEEPGVPAPDGILIDNKILVHFSSSKEYVCFEKNDDFLVQTKCEDKAIKKYADSSKYDNREYRKEILEAKELKNYNIKLYPRQNIFNALKNNEHIDTYINYNNNASNNTIDLMSGSNQQFIIYDNQLMIFERGDKYSYICYDIVDYGNKLSRNTCSEKIKNMSNVNPENETPVEEEIYEKRKN